MIEQGSGIRLAHSQDTPTLEAAIRMTQTASRAFFACRGTEQQRLLAAARALIAVAQGKPEPSRYPRTPCEGET